MDDTLTLRLDYTSYTMRPAIDEECRALSATVATGQTEDSLSAARGVLVGLAVTLPIWALILALVF